AGRDDEVAARAAGRLHRDLLAVVAVDVELAQRPALHDRPWARGDPFAVVVTRGEAPGDERLVGDGQPLADRSLSEPSPPERALLAERTRARRTEQEPDHPAGRARLDDDRRAARGSLDRAEPPDALAQHLVSDIRGRRQILEVPRARVRETRGSRVAFVAQRHAPPDRAHRALV